ncbi:Methyltransferase TYW3, putative [Trypanosoma equiperdum]|uniref:tRNA(Phe) 7-[(3-amino-3-carboxypropyl)-4-demethylwyosine(37)-N(4)]-methyltransferase n=1 Tax=Trypanosoma equiperdum TaxID=5694 RepID=A0A1G4I6E3_TRYEQ|nr:Methyltransferase TYW3, putative [Trypanosoma equiperdum]
MVMRAHLPLLSRASTLAFNQPVPNSTFFGQRRQKILEDLQENKNDKSLAGRVDPQVAPLVQFINEHFSCYVTSSSCSGRVSLFHKGQLSAGCPINPLAEAKVLKADANADMHNRKRGAFGQGALFQSHDPIPNVEEMVTQRLVPVLGSFEEWRSRQLQLEGGLKLMQEKKHFDSLLHETELLELKFEPMIVHVQCETLDDAARLLQCANESGQMESGILSCSRGANEQRKITCCITSSLRVALPLFAQGCWLLGHPKFDSAEWRSLLTNALVHMNVLFGVNEQRRGRFLEKLQKQLL